jgi:UDPglucose 6-dehydrogenase
MGNSSVIHIVGAGVVGSATGNAFESLEYDVRYIELLAAKREQLAGAGKRVAAELELHDDPDSFIFICVPTPSATHGYDLTHLRAALQSIGGAIAHASGFHVVVVRSTVAPLTWSRVTIPELEAASGKVEGRDFAVASAPEFLRQVSATGDALHPRVTVVAATDPAVRTRLADLFAPLGGTVHAFEDPTVTETIKMTNNCFNAAKISFSNEIWRVCQHLGIPQDVVAKVVAESAEGSYSPAYGIIGGYPYGGACLPKDLDGLLGFGLEEGLELPLLTAVREVNLEIASSMLDEGIPSVIEAVD